MVKGIGNQFYQKFNEYHDLTLLTTKEELEKVKKELEPYLSKPKEVENCGPGSGIYYFVDADLGKDPNFLTQIGASHIQPSGNKFVLDRDGWMKSLECYLKALELKIRKLGDNNKDREREREREQNLNLCDNCQKPIQGNYREMTDELTKQSYGKICPKCYECSYCKKEDVRVKTNEENNKWITNVWLCENCSVNATPRPEHSKKVKNDKGWPPNWLNNCALCEKQYQEAKEKVQSEPNRYELKEKSECGCCHRFNLISCDNCLGTKWIKYIGKNGEQLNEQGLTHSQIGCLGATSQGASSSLRPVEFYKTKLGQICDVCQKTINSLENWEIEAKKQMTKDCSNGKHHTNNGNFITGSGSGGYPSQTADFNDKALHCGGKPTIKNWFGDIKPCPICSKNNSSRNQQLQNLLSSLIQVQQFIIANNIHSITNQNGNLVITFNTNTNTTPPSQTITDEELTSETSTLNNEEKTMWQKFKDYLKKIGKNKMNKQELAQEINKLKTNSEKKPKETKIWPWIVGGIGIISVLTIVIALILNRKSKNKK